MKYIYLLLMCSVCSVSAQISYNSGSLHDFFIANEGPTNSQQTALPLENYTDQVNWTSPEGSIVNGNYFANVTSSNIAYNAYSSVDGASKIIQAPNPAYDPSDPSSTEPEFINQSVQEEVGLFNLLYLTFTVDQDTLFNVCGTGLTNEDYHNSYTYFSVKDQTNSLSLVNVVYSASGVNPINTSGPSVDKGGTFNMQIQLLANTEYSILVDAKAGQDMISDDDIAAWSQLKFCMDAVPEPSSTLLLGLGCFFSILSRRR